VSQLPSYLSLCLLITLTPGLDTAVVVRSAVTWGRGAGLRTAVGCAAGLFVHAVAVALGLAGLLLSSAVAFEVVKLCGAAFLVLLGARSLWSAWRDRSSASPPPVPPLPIPPLPMPPVPMPPVPMPPVPMPPGPVQPVPVPAASPTPPRPRRTPFVQGLLTNLTNPKATVFFAASLPQFIPADRPATAVPVALLLASIAVLFSVTGLSLTALAVSRVRHLLRSRRARRIQEGLLGATLVFLGVRVATE
jgi:threonine/homoserine/homoserine lactone efflux protein